MRAMPSAAAGWLGAWRNWSGHGRRNRGLSRRPQHPPAYCPGIHRGPPVLLVYPFLAAQRLELPLYRLHEAPCSSLRDDRMRRNRRRSLAMATARTAPVTRVAQPHANRLPWPHHRLDADVLDESAPKTISRVILTAKDLPPSWTATIWADAFDLTRTLKCPCPRRSPSSPGLRLDAKPASHNATMRFATFASPHRREQLV